MKNSMFCLMLFVAALNACFVSVSGAEITCYGCSETEKINATFDTTGTLPKTCEAISTADTIWVSDPANIHCDEIKTCYYCKNYAVENESIRVPYGQTCEIMTGNDWHEDADELVCNPISFGTCSLDDGNNIQVVALFSALLFLLLLACFLWIRVPAITMIVSLCFVVLGMSLYGCNFMVGGITALFGLIVFVMEAFQIGG